jgi:hypothetical protein
LIFNKNPFSAIFFGLLVAAFLWVPNFGNMPHIQDNVPTMPLEHWLMQWVEAQPLFSNIITLLLTLVFAILLVKLEQTHLFAFQWVYVAPFIFILLCSAFPLQKCMGGAYVATLFFFIALFLLFRLYKAERVYTSLFYAGMFMACAALFAAPSIFLILLLPIALILFRQPFAWREHVIAFFGVCTPVFFTCVVYYFLYNDATIFFSVLYNSLFSLSAWIYENGHTSEKIYLAYLMFLMLQTILLMVKGLFTSKQKVKKIHSLLLWAFCILLFVSLFLPSGSMFLMPLLAVPSSVLIANYLIATKMRKWAGVQFLILIALTFFIQYV